jgi:hypothetical protein
MRGHCPAALGGPRPTFTGWTEYASRAEITVYTLEYVLAANRLGATSRDHGSTTNSDQVSDKKCVEVGTAVASRIYQDPKEKWIRRGRRRQVETHNETSSFVQRPSRAATPFPKEEIHGY